MKKSLVSFIIVFILFFQSTNVDAQTYKNNIKKNLLEGKIPVLMYHSIKNKSTNEYELSTSKFKRQMKYLYKKGHTTLSIDEYYKIIDGKSKMPKKPVLITFDDGALDNYKKAYPILKKYKMKATFFVVANWINNEEYMNEEQIKEVSKNNIDIQCHGLNHEWYAKLSYDEQYESMNKARFKISEIVGMEVNYFAFPYGNINESAMTALYDLGYKMGFSSIGGLSSENDNRYCIKRQYISGEYNFKEFRYKLIK